MSARVVLYSRGACASLDRPPQSVIGPALRADPVADDGNRKQM